jgi:sarcosine oxidase subunit beta
VSGSRAAAVRRLLATEAAPATAGTVIVGAGIAGLSLALELARRGVEDVVVVEKGYPGSGATSRNVARIRAMQLTEELCAIAARCQAKYDAMGDELGFNVLFYRMGYAWVLYEDEEVARMRAIVDMHHRIGVRSVLLDPKGTLDALPCLKGGDAPAGAVVHHDGIVHHDAVLWALLEALAGTSVRLLPGTEVTGIERMSDAVTGVLTGRGPIATGRVVNAAAGWSGGVSRMAGLAVPNRPYRREVLVTSSVTRFIDKAVTFYRPHEGWFNQTLRGEVVMGAVDPDEPSAVNQASSWDFLKRTARLMTRKAPALADLTVIRQWGGMYDVTPDHLPAVGPTAQLGGWWQMNGWSGRGMLLAPHLAERLALRMTGVADAVPAMFDPDRFPTDGAADHEQDRDYYARYAPAPSR